MKTLEINRDGSAISETNLRDTFLKKTEGYVMQVTRFVVNNSPTLNLIDEPMFTVLTRGGQANDTVDTVQVLNPPLIFQPTNYRTYLELARQLEKFCKQIDQQLQQASVAFSLQSNGLFQLGSRSSPVWTIKHDGWHSNHHVRPPTFRGRRRSSTSCP